MTKRCFDPRDPDQTDGDITTWAETDNPALIRAGKAAADAARAGMPVTQSFWNKVAAEADEADAKMLAAVTRKPLKSA